MNFIYENIKKYVKKLIFCILKVTEDFGMDPDPLPDPDPYQNVTDPEHRFIYCVNMHRILMTLQLRALESLKLSLNSLNAEKTMAERQLKEDRAIKTQKEEEIQ